MHDIKLIRTTPEKLDHSLQRRGQPAASSQILELDTQLRSTITELQALQAQRNKIAQQFGEAKRKQEDTSALSAESDTIKGKMSTLEEQERFLQQKLTEHLSVLPNIVDESVPEGADETENVEIRRVGTPRSFSFTPLAHYDLGENLKLMDFETATKISGARFVLLYGQLAQLERALASFMIDQHRTLYQYKEVYAPLLVSEKSMYGTGQLPKLREDMFQTNMGHWLIPTSEVVLTNIAADEILNESDLPLRLTAYTPCFRAEAGAAGRDTRGMIRQHQFGKVEMVTLCHPDSSETELERMTEAAENILKKLELPYRVVTLCAGDISFNATKTYDIEVWLPSQETYREISSCSNCKDFQARRMNGRFRPAASKETPKPGTEFLHTLNGSGLAVGRTLVAILENYQQEDGRIEIPKILRPYMGNLEFIEGVQ